MDEAHSGQRVRAAFGGLLAAWPEAREPASRVSKGKAAGRHFTTNPWKSQRTHICPESGRRHILPTPLHGTGDQDLKLPDPQVRDED